MATHVFRSGFTPATPEEIAAEAEREERRTDRESLEAEAAAQQAAEAARGKAKQQAAAARTLSRLQTQRFTSFADLRHRIYPKEHRPS